MNTAPRMAPRWGSGYVIGEWARDVHLARCREELHQSLSPWVREISYLALGIEIARSSTMKSILIADGSEYVADLFADVFTCHAWAVTRYTNSERAREALRGRAHYEAVLVGYRFDGGLTAWS